jgi:hypothetical protein
MASSFRDFTIWQYFASIIKLVKLLAQCEELPLTGIFQRLFKVNFVSYFQALSRFRQFPFPIHSLDFQNVGKQSPIEIASLRSQ